MLKNVRKSLRVHVFQIVQKSVKYGRNGSIQTGLRKTTERVTNQVVIMIKMMVFYLTAIQLGMGSSMKIMIDLFAKKILRLFRIRNRKKFKTTHSRRSARNRSYS